MAMLGDTSPGVISTAPLPPTCGMLQTPVQTGATWQCQLSAMNVINLPSLLLSKVVPWVSPPGSFSPLPVVIDAAAWGLLAYMLLKGRRGA
jgi:hypothetical protein